MKRYWLLALPLLALTACDIDKHEYHVEYIDGVTFDFKADSCGLYKDNQLLVCQSDGVVVYSIGWNLVKHFRDLTQDRRDQDAKERQQYNEKHKDDSSGGGILGPIIVLHILGII